MTGIEFRARPFADSPGCHEVTPIVGGVPLSELVDDFERRHMYEPPGGYGGLIPEYFRFGTAVTHFFGAKDAFLDSDGRVPLLGCPCGEWGCWPLLAKVTADDERVTWSDFKQPHRPDRDYSEFGPFVFDRSDYLAAVRALAEIWGPNDSNAHGDGP